VEIFGAHVWKGGSKILKFFPINFLAVPGNSKHFSFFPEKNLKIDSDFFLLTPNLIAKFQTATITRSGRKVMVAEEREKQAGAELCQARNQQDSARLDLARLYITCFAKFPAVSLVGVVGGWVGWWKCWDEN
jgi:hypothetical protein